MQAAVRKPRTNHIDLAQKILDIATERGLQLGARLPEQQIASLCNVSRTPVRAAFRLLAERGLIAVDLDGGYRLAADPAASDAGAASLPVAEEDDLGESILRDRAARRLDASVAAGDLARRYGVARQTVLKALKRLSEDGFVERASGQAWLFRPAPDGPDAIADSYEFRLLTEPAAILAPGFRLDGAKAATLRAGTEVLLAMPDSAFDIRECQRLDREFHAMVASGCANRFLADALGAHHRLRRVPGAMPGVSVYRLRQSTREHLAILDQLESRQEEIAADLMRVHLRLSHAQRPHAANRGAPALTGTIRRPASHE
ncbi:MAG: GntR family transcriptional regulator [Rhizobiaceae bacterium]|nr:GntR family transcriptional regulator [Rhizobiaceae bacterium]